MKRKLCHLIYLFAFCLCAIGGFTNLHAQSSNAPVLSLAPGASPTLTVSGTVGATYQVQSTAQLLASNQWTALTNILLSNSPYLLQDPAAASNAIRFYRALLVSLPSNIFNGYAPTQISPGENYQFTSVSGGITNIQTLIVNSPTDGVWITSTFGPSQPVSPVTLQFTRLDSLTVNLAVIFLAGNNPFPTTNTYLLVFTAANSGLFQFSGFPTPFTGTFARNTSLVNQTPAPQQLSGGEIWQISLSNGGFLSGFQTLVVESTTNAWSIVPGTGGIGSGTYAATAQFTPQGPFTGSLVIAVPSTTAWPMGTTNDYLVEFTTANSGIILGPTNAPAMSVGTFTRDTRLVGKIVAPAQLTVGEKYQAVITNGINPALQYLLVDSSTNDWWVVPGNQITSGIFPATAQLTRLGPLSGSLTVIQPMTQPVLPITTNVYLLVFTGTNSGAFSLLTSGPPTTVTGTFVRDTTLVGQNLAPSELSVSATCQFNFFGFGAGVQTLSAASATSGLWLTQGSVFNDGISTNSLQYTPMSAFSASIAVTPAPNQGIPNPNGSTNFYLLLFTAPNTGAFQVTSIPSTPSGVSPNNFVFSTNSVGKTFSPQQLTLGESFQFTVTNNGIAQTSETLEINSLTNSIWFNGDGSPQGGLYTASVQYSPFGPLAANLGVILPVSVNFPSGATNSFVLLFNSPTNGIFQSTNTQSPTIQLGTFTHSTP